MATYDYLADYTRFFAIGIFLPCYVAKAQSADVKMGHSEHGMSGSKRSA